MSDDRPPEFTLRGRPPTVRCFRCGSPDVTALCPRCHRAMCKADPPPRRWSTESRRMLPPAWRRRISAAPNAGLCVVCEPVLPDVGRMPLAACFAPAACGAVAFAWSAAAGTLLLIVGAALTGALLRRTVRQKHGWRHIESRHLRLTPAINRISLVDEVEATAELQDGTYSITPPTTRGTLTIEAEWGDAARETVRAHVDGRPAVPLERLTFDAGILVLRGESGLEFDVTSTRLPLHWIRPGILMLTDRVRDHGRLVGDEPAKRAWTITAGYTITDRPEQERVLPVWLTPTLVPRADRRSLDLEIQWAEFGPEKGGMPLVAIDLLQVRVPATWDSLLNTRPGNATLTRHETPDGRRTIEWRNLNEVPHTTRGRQCFSMQFQNRIEEGDRIAGKIVARFDGTLCRVSGVDLYDFSGKKRADRPRRRRHTNVVLNFDLALTSLRYEDLRILPPEGTDDGESYDGIVPNAHTVATLTTTLSESDCYVKRVIENPGRPGKEPSTTYRFWDIAGRKYTGVYPIDFHITVTGSERYRGATVTAARTVFSLRVRGAYSSADGDALVHREWENLWAQIDDALRNRGMRCSDGPEAGRMNGDRP